MRAELSGEVRLVIPAEMEWLAVSLDFTRVLLARMGAGADMAGTIEMGVEELVSNVIRHAYGGIRDQKSDLKATILFQPFPAGIRITVSDEGYGKADPGYIPFSSEKELAEGRGKGGDLGLTLLYSLFEDVSVSLREEGGREVSFVATFAGAERSDRG